MPDFFDNFFSIISKKTKDLNHEYLYSTVSLIESTRQNNGKVIIVGNGGSAAIASHFAVDLTKVAGIRSVNFNESSLLTCFSNDFGYENWIEKAIDFYADNNDLIILISSSGRSQNMINGAKKSIEKELKLVTLTGFNEDNKLKKMGEVNFWVDSEVYNVIENVHQIWLLSIIDFIIEKQNGVFN